jgi:hypothetical protein
LNSFRMPVPCSDSRYRSSLVAASPRASDRSVVRRQRRPLFSRRLRQRPGRRARVRVAASNFAGLFRNRSRLRLKHPLNGDGARIDPAPDAERASATMFDNADRGSTGGDEICDGSFCARSYWRWPLAACSGFNARHRHVPTPAREMALCIRPAIAGVDRKIQTAKSSGGPAERKF